MLDTIKSPWAIGCLIYGVVAVIILFAVVGVAALLEETGGDPNEIGPAFCLPFLVWQAGSLPGLFLLYQKKYVAWFSRIVGGLGCVALLFLGPMAIPVGLVLWIFTGPFLWLFALALPARRGCPHCTEVISGRATRCPHCGGEVEPIA
jgi:hypothetical protein